MVVRECDSHLVLFFETNTLLSTAFMIFVISDAPLSASIGEHLQLDLDQPLCPTQLLNGGLKLRGPHIQLGRQGEHVVCAKVVAACAPLGATAPVCCVAIARTERGAAQSFSYDLDRNQSSATTQSTFYAGRVRKPNGGTMVV